MTNLQRLMVTKIIFLSLSSSFVMANAPESESLEHIIVTTTREEANADSIIGNIAQVTAEEIQLVGHAHIQELLIRVPGVNLQRGNGQEYLPAIRSPVLTGAGACGSFLIAEDNIPLRSAGFCNINELFEAHTEQARRIEVIRGPGTSFHGSNALNGVINVLTPEVPTSQQNMLGLETGSYGFYRLTGQTGDYSDKQGFNIALTATHNEGYRDESGYDQHKLSGRHLFDGNNITINSGFTITNLQQETAGYITGLDSYKDSDIASSNPNPEAFRDAKSLRLWSNLKYPLTEQTHLSFTPYIRHTEMEFMMHFLPGKPIEENSQKSIGFQSAYFNGSMKDISLTIGLDGEMTNAYLKQTQRHATEGSKFLQVTIPAGKQYDYKVNANMIAPFVHLNWLLSERWALSAGLRYENINYDYHNKMLSGRTTDNGTVCGFGGCRYSRPNDSKDTFDNWSPKFGISYQLSEEVLAFTNISKGFRAPQATELYRLQRDQLVANLDSVQADSLELGLRANHDSLRYEITAYMVETDHVIFRDSAYFNISDGYTEHEGIEAQLNYDINHFFDLGFNLSYARHRYAKEQFLGDLNIDGNDIDSAPRHFGTLQLGWKISSSSRVELEWLHVGSYFMDAENAHQYEGHDLLNLRARWSLSDKWHVFARINNLTNEKYAERADYTTFSHERYFPGTPTTVFVGVQWQPN